MSPPALPPSPHNRYSDDEVFSLLTGGGKFGPVSEYRTDLGFYSFMYDYNGTAVVRQLVSIHRRLGRPLPAASLLALVPGCLLTQRGRWIETALRRPTGGCHRSSGAT